MSDFCNYRCRWLGSLGFAIVERRHERKDLGFWPVYIWEPVAHFRTRGDGVKWMIEQGHMNERGRE